jgi:predicted nucleic acid-binding protein
MTKILTFIDASVLIYAAKKPTKETIGRRFRALHLLADPERQFMASEFLKLEVLPLPRYFNRLREVAFYDTFFAGVALWADSADLTVPAYKLACNFGIGAMDALHLAAAKQFDAEFVSAERPTKPIYRAYKKAHTIY